MFLSYGGMFRLPHGVFAGRCTSFGTEAEGVGPIDSGVDDPQMLQDIQSCEALYGTDARLQAASPRFPPKWTNFRMQLSSAQTAWRSRLRTEDGGVVGTAAISASQAA